MSSGEYRTREQYWDYNDYLKYRQGNCYYNKGLDLKSTNVSEAIKYFKLALKKKTPKIRIFYINYNYLLLTILHVIQHKL